MPSISVRLLILYEDQLLVTCHLLGFNCRLKKVLFQMVPLAVMMSINPYVVLDS